LLVEAAGYPQNQYAINRVAKELGVPLSTLRSWAKGEHGAPPAKLYEHKKGELTERLNAAANMLVARIIEIVDTGDLKETATALGIVIDKLQLLSGEQPTQNINQRIVIEYADDTDILTEAATVAERRYQDISEVQ
jgi:DNA-binding transcriptional MerR regulator